MFLQNIIVIPIVLMLSVSALKLYRTLVRIDKNASVKGEIIRHTVLCLILTVPLIVAAFIEAYISSGLMCLYK